MDLITIHKATATEREFVLDLDLTAVLEGEEQRIPFVYDPADPYGLNPEVTAWLMSNPDFPIDPYVPPIEPDPVDPLTLTLTKRQIARAMIIGANIPDPDAFVEAAIEAIVDPTARALARADWRYAPYYIRSHPLFSDTDMMAAAQMTSQSIDALWALGALQPA